MPVINYLPCRLFHKAGLSGLSRVLLLLTLSFGFNTATYADYSNCAIIGPGPIPLAVVNNTTALNDAIDCFNMVTSAGTYIIRFDGNITLSTASTPIQNTNIGVELKIEGRNFALDGNSNVRGLTIESNTTVTMEALTVRNGKPDNSDKDGRGGGIYNDGTLTLNNSTVSDNESEDEGGGIYNDGTLTLNNSTVSDNESEGDGGGIYNRGTLTLNNSTVSDNESDDGGGIFNNGPLTLDNSTVSNNEADSDGGGIYHENGTVTVNNSTLNGNNADSIGGGGIHNTAGNLTINNSTLSDNTTKGQNDTGGGIYNKGTLILNNSTLNGNKTESFVDGDSIHNDGGSATINNTIITGNTREPLAPPKNCRGTITTTGNNLSTDNSCGAATVITDPLLGPLANNGGATLTHKPLANSPVLDAGDNATCTTHDQHGTARPVDADGDGTATCNIGAVETPTLIYGITDASVTEGTGGSTNLTFTITRTLSNAASSVRVSTSNGSATAGSDYTALNNQVVNFASGDTTQTVNVAITTDSLAEADETLTITLSNPSTGYTIEGSGKATGTIEDDDDPTLTLVIAAASISESDGAAATTATVTRNTDTTAALTVNLSSNDTSEATVPTVPASVTIPAGQAAVTFDIAAVDDAIADGTQTVDITASATGHADGKDSVNVNDDERDNDSASNADEAAAPNGGDGNDDGTPDVEQNNVASFPAVVTGGGSGGGIYYTVELDTGGGASPGCTPINNTGATTEAALGGDTEDFDYLAGLLQFTLNCAQAEIVLYFHGLSSAPIAIRKYSPATDTWYNMPGASIETVTINGQTVYKATYTLTDGGVGDDDGVVNGTIVDPVGPAWAAAGAGGAGAGGAGSSAQNIPVFGPFGLLAMLLGLLWFGGRQRSQRV